MTTEFQPAESDLTSDFRRGFVPFPADRAEAYRQAGYWTGRRLDSILSNAASAHPDKAAVIDTDRSLTFAELDAAADRFGAALAALGISPGDRVLLQMHNCAHFAIALFGLLRAGAVPVMCLPGHRAASSP